MRGTVIHAVINAVLLLALVSGCGRNLSFNSLNGNTPSGEPSTTPTTPAATSTATATSTVSGTATLIWEKPAMMTDGSALADLAGYRIHFGTAPGVYTTTIALNDPAVLTYTVNDLAPGKTYYFAVSAVSTSAGESDFSNEASKAIH